MANQINNNNESRKKILFVCGGTYLFGAERITLSVIEGLVNAGCEVHCMVSGWNDGKFINELKRIGVSYTIFKLGWIYISKLRWTLDSLIHYPGAIATYLKAVKKFKPDVVYHYSYRTIFLLQFFSGKNIMFNVQDNLSLFKEARLILKIINRKVRYYTTCSQFIYKDLVICGIKPEKIEVVYNFISVKNEVNDIGFAKKDLKSQKLNIGIVGQIAEYKGTEIAIRAIEQLKMENENVLLNIIGGGNEDYINYLKELINAKSLTEYICWQGYKGTQAEIYKDLDIVLVPTILPEPFGLVAIEPISYGIPVIASRNGGLQEIIIDQQTGMLFTTADYNELASKIKLFANNKELRNIMAYNALQRLNEHFTSLAQVPKIIAILKKYF